MATITMEEQPDFALLPVDSIVGLKVKEVVVREVNGRNGTWEKLEFTFEITDIQAIGDGSPVANYDSAVGSKIWGSVPFRLTDSQENKLRLWAEALLNMELGLGFQLDTEYFVGREVRGLIGQYEKKTMDPTTGRPFKGHQVASLLPKGAIQPAAPQPQPQAPVAQPAAQPVAPQPVAPQPQPQLTGGTGWEEPPF